MKPNDLLTFDGVFAAVRCAVCGAVYNATSDDFIAFHGGLTAGLSDTLVDWSAPKRPKKRSVTVVCRTPECIEKLVRQLLGCAPDTAAEGVDSDQLWSQVLRIWATRQGLSVSDPDHAAVEVKKGVKTQLRVKSKQSAAA